MCIRDSVVDELLQAEVHHGGEPAARCEFLERAAAHARGVAVSYTHLRAHETVLDLVCRFLLVKN